MSALLMLTWLGTGVWLSVGRPWWAWCLTLLVCLIGTALLSRGLVASLTSGRPLPGLLLAPLGVVATCLVADQRWVAVVVWFVVVVAVAYVDYRVWRRRADELVDLQGRRSADRGPSSVRRSPRPPSEVRMPEL